MMEAVCWLMKSISNEKVYSISLADFSGFWTRMRNIEISVCNVLNMLALFEDLRDLKKRPQAREAL
jgi:hypothetical protein